MILGVSASDNRIAARLVDRMVSAFPSATVSLSIESGVAIACVSGIGPSIGCTFDGNVAHVGAWGGGIPSPGTELAGDFALIARKGNALRMARGRFVGRPLYWTRTDDAIVACSRLLPLARLLRGRLELNLDHLFALFDGSLWAWVHPLPFHGFARVRSNTIVDASASGRANTHVGTIHIGAELDLRPHDLAAAVREQFRLGVARQCAGVQSVAVLAGGGVDSSGLLATAVYNERERGGASVIPVAFHYGGQGDDRPYFADLCRCLRVEPIRVLPAEGQPFGLRDRIVDASAHAIGPATILFAAMARARAVGATLALSGEASEALFDSDAPVFANFFLHSPLRAMACAARFQAIYETKGQSARRLILGPLARRFLPTPMHAVRRHLGRGRVLNQRARRYPWAGPLFVDFLRKDSVPRPVGTPIYSQRDRVLQLASSPLLMAVGEMFARWEIATGMPIRRAYFDDAFVKFVARVPSAAIFAGARERGLLRESMEASVPDSIRHRMDKARPSDAFADEFLAMGGYEAVVHLLDMRELARLRIVDPRAFRAEFDKFAADPKGHPSAWSSLWPAITAEAYVRWFLAFNDLGRECVTEGHD